RTRAATAASMEAAGRPAVAGVATWEPAGECAIQTVGSRRPADRDTSVCPDAEAAAAAARNRILTPVTAVSPHPAPAPAAGAARPSPVAAIGFIAREGNVAERQRCVAADENGAAKARPTATAFGAVAAFGDRVGDGEVGDRRV